MWLWGLIVAAAWAQTPAFPEYFPTWTAAFSEEVIDSKGKSHNTTGTSYYDSTTWQLRVDRTNAGADQFCALNGLGKLGFDGQCSHYVTGGARYLYYPETDECCLCCTDADGCGVVMPDWLHNATFSGEMEHNGDQTYKWDQKGMQDNFYYETVAEDPMDRALVSLYQMNDDLQDFADYSHDVPAGVFDLPTACLSKERCALLSVCTLVSLASLFD